MRCCAACWSGCGGGFIRMGRAAGADFRLQLLESPNGSGGLATGCFEVNYRGLVLGPFALHVPGRHNVLNATAAVAMGVQLGSGAGSDCGGVGRAFVGWTGGFRLRAQCGV